MKNQNQKIEKWLVIVGGLALCMVLVIAISSQFQKAPIIDEPLPVEEPTTTEVNVDKSLPATEEKEVVVTKPDIQTPTEEENKAVDQGTKQTIQGDVEKKEYTDEQLKDPIQKPNGEKVEEEKKEKPKDPPTPEKPSGGNSIPGFDNVPDGGANQGEFVDGDGDINKQVGTMN